MADVLIKGMEMPKNCESCPVCDYEQGNCLLANERNTLPHDGSRKEWCPLVEVTPSHRIGINGEWQEIWVKV